MKTFDAMALLEDRKSSISTLYPSSDGKITLNGKTITDAKEGGFGELSLGNALAYSSNTIFAQAVTNAYRKDPSAFVTRLKNCFNLSALHLPFEVKSNPYFPRVNSPEWSEFTLPLLAVGYGLKLSPIQILTYYNALANNGTLVQPRFISLIKNKEGDKKHFTKSNIHAKICSNETSKKITYYLRKSLLKGNGQTLNKNGAPQKYLAGFAGYFPYLKPKYSIIALVGNLQLPSPHIAGNLAKNIAETTIN
jgi:cell division protein FtsI (penicillin-binding protein 3)